MKKKKSTGGFLSAQSKLSATWQMGLFAEAQGEARLSSASLWKDPLMKVRHSAVFFLLIFVYSVSKSSFWDPCVWQQTRPLLRAVQARGAAAASSSSSGLRWVLPVFSSCWLPPCGWNPTWELQLQQLCCRAPQSCSTWPGPELRHSQTSGRSLELSDASEPFHRERSTPCWITTTESALRFSLQLLIWSSWWGDSEQGNRPGTHGSLGFCRL